MKTCLYCGTEFTGKATTAKYCQPICARRAYSKARQVDGRHKAYKQTERAKESQRRYLKSARMIRDLGHCCVCARPIALRSDRDTQYCSPTCAAWERHGYPSSPVPSAHPSRSCPVPQDHPARRGRCARCTGAFTVEARGQLYCSRVCRSRAGSSRRDARERGAFVSDVSPHEIYERDHWVCHLCAEPIDRDAKVPHPLAPTIDHVVPLARGGTHEPGNVKAAHFICNATKRDRIDFVIAAPQAA